MRLTTMLTPVALAAIVGASAMPTASAAEPAPTASCGLAFTDPSGDHNPAEPGIATAQEPDNNDVNLDILEGWLDWDPSKGDKGLTANIRVADLTTRASQGGTGVVWNFIYDSGGETRFVRAFTDLAGGPYFEYGVRQPASTDSDPTSGEVPDNPLPLPRFAYQGKTEGKLFPGPNGVVQIVIPKEAGGGAGADIQHPHASGNASKQVVPGAVTQAPTRGVSTQADVAPDEATPGAGGEAFKASSCSPVQELAGDTGGDQAAAPAADAAAAPAAAAEAPAAAPTPAAPVAAPAARGVTVLSTTAKRLKKGRTLTLRLRSAEALKRVTVQVRRGSSLVGSGRLAKLTGAGAAKVKLRKALGKGRYTVTVTGTDARGAKQTVKSALTVR